jgi:hypothetical protein
VTPNKRYVLVHVRDSNAECPALTLGLRPRSVCDQGHVVVDWDRAKVLWQPTRGPGSNV